MYRRLSSLSPAIALALCASAIFPCAPSFAQQANSLARSQLPPSNLVGLDPTSIDRGVDPCNDLYDYANGLWTKENTIPSDRPEWGIFEEAQKRNNIALHEILDNAAADTNAPVCSNIYKVGAFYRSGMDTAAIEAAGIKPLEPEIRRINEIHTTRQLAVELAHLHRIGIGAGFSFYVASDFKDSSRQTPQVYQGGIGLPDRDYYFRKDPDSKLIRVKYLRHVDSMMTFMGDPAPIAAGDAAVIMKIETRLAHSSMTQVEQRNPSAIYNPMTISQIDSLAPGFDWRLYFRSVGLAKLSSQDFNISQPKFFREFGDMVSSPSAVPLRDWQTYLRWQLIDGAAPYLSSPIEAEDFAFNETTLNGSTKMRPRWERVNDVIDGEIGEALGQLYVERTFSPYAKEKAKELVLNVKAELRRHLLEVDWMSPATKAAALAKCDAMLIKVGYPDKWRDYSPLHITDRPYVLNVFAANEFEFQRDLNKIGKPTDRMEWDMTPPTINADYEDSTNSINIPAGILQPPFFDPSYDDPVNYGELGATVGHEMTHGFDDEGRQYNAHGNLSNWWTPSDKRNFDMRAARIVAQYGAYEPLPGLHIDGELSLGENIADIGGLKIAYLALEKDLQGKPKTLIDGFTPEQRYFISYAQGWRDMMRPEYERELLQTDPHSPPMYRVNGPCGDMPEFFQAFGSPVPATAYEVAVW